MDLLPIAVCVLMSSALVAQTSNSSSEANAKFAKLSEEFIHETLALSPSTASQAGYHQHIDPKSGKTVALDALLDDMSAAGINEQRRVYARWRERFRSETPLASLGVEDAADWQLIDDQIALNLLEFDRIQNYKHNPTVYVELVGSALFQPLTDDYAPEDFTIRRRKTANWRRRLPMESPGGTARLCWWVWRERLFWRSFGKLGSPSPRRHLSTAATSLTGVCARAGRKTL